MKPKYYKRLVEITPQQEMHLEVDHYLEPIPEITELLEALKEAVLTIRLWHGINEDIPTERESWRLYLNSPEMKRINEAIEKATS